MQFSSITVLSILAFGTQVFAAPVEKRASAITTIHSAVMTLEGAVAPQLTTIGTSLPIS